MSLLLVIGLGFGLASEPATAEPCPFPAHHGAMTGQETQGAETKIAPAAMVEPVAIAAPEQPDARAPHPVPEHAVPVGHSCCHVAAAVAPVCGPELVLRRRSGSIPPQPWLPPRAAPTTDIYRPPAFG
jgi:hypothetical protein